MIIAIQILHILACLVLILVVLLQTGKGSEMGAVFGGSSQTVFGSGGAAPFLSKFTTGIAVVFMITSLSLATIAMHPAGSSLMEDEPAAPVSAPVTIPEEPLVPEETESAEPQAATPEAQIPPTVTTETEQAQSPSVSAQPQPTTPPEAAPKTEQPAATH